jgi:hypothetical protein
MASAAAACCRDKSDPGRSGQRRLLGLVLPATSSGISSSDEVTITATEQQPQSIIITIIIRIADAADVRG